MADRAGFILARQGPGRAGFLARSACLLNRAVRCCDRDGLRAGRRGHRACYQLSELQHVPGRSGKYWELPVPCRYSARHGSTGWEAASDTLPGTARHGGKLRVNDCGRAVGRRFRWTGRGWEGRWTKADRICGWTPRSED